MDQELTSRLKDAVDGMVEEWNQWRQDHHCHFWQANAWKQLDLSGVDLHDGDLMGIDFSGTDLTGADLTGADLLGANLCQADLTGADLTGARLLEANLTGAVFDETDMSGVGFGGTVFAQLDLRSVEGLDTAWHQGPSQVDVKTIIFPQDNVLKSFLRGTGFPDPLIDYLLSLWNVPIQYQSCFISYSSKDDLFAKKLYADLQESGVRCWFAPKDLKTGAKLRPSIDESIRLHDKLLLVLSQDSIVSQWVEQEVERALARERKEDKVILFPIRLDRAVMGIEEGWPALIRNTRNISDFTYWKKNDKYQKALNRLLRDLKAQT